MTKNKHYLGIGLEDIIISFDISCFSRRTLSAIESKCNISKEKLLSYGGLKEVKVNKYELADLVIRDVESPVLAYNLGLFMAEVLKGKTRTVTSTEIKLVTNFLTRICVGESNYVDFSRDVDNEIFLQLFNIALEKLRAI